MFAGAVAALGLLLWARLIVLSDMPRTAIAEEESPMPASDKSAVEQPETPTPAIPSASERDDRETRFGNSIIKEEFGSEADKSPSQVTEDPE
ncbi:MAG: hypothetical protein HKO59_06090 [Phycisphaerales bacterium]|nr:hypothetical protein [Phycisphaerales bacterium]NNM25543.1 hypothetical protein [Phycisphaerales bacterium]